VAPDVKSLVWRDKTVERAEQHLEIRRFFLPRDHDLRAKLGCFFLSGVAIDRIARFFPGVPATGDIAHVVETFAF